MVEIARKIIFAALVAAGTGVARCVWITNHFFTDTVSIICLLSTAVFLDMYRLKPSPQHTWKTLIFQYLFNKLISLFGSIAMFRFNKLCRNYKEQQSELLKDILRQNRNTIFAKDHSLLNVQTAEEFRKTMPLTTYNDYIKYAEMVKTGHAEDVLFPGRPFFIAYTSGTTSGKSKAFPKYYPTHTRNMSWMILSQFLMGSIENGHLLLKWFFVKVKVKTFQSKSGIESGSISSILYKLNLPFIVPQEVRVFQEFDSLYINLVFGLSEHDTNSLSIVTATTTLSLLSILEKHWEELCYDVETGKLSKKLAISHEERIRLENQLSAQPDRATFLRTEFKKGMQGIVPRLWPNCSCLFAIKTGVFEAPAKVVQNKYLGHIPIVTLLHIGTESIYGVNLSPRTQPEVDFTLLIPISFFEFIPEEEIEKENPETVFGNEVKVGSNYEMVITTYDGLYRYRTGDVIKITGFHGNTPVYRFMGRVGEILSVGTEKVPEFLLQSAIQTVAAQSAKTIVEYTSCESIHVQNIEDNGYLEKRYIVFVEMQDDILLSDSEVKLIDQHLRELHDVYSAMRANGTLEPVRVIHMRPETFNIVKQMVLATNPEASCMQYKLPRIMRRTAILRCMLERRLE